MYSCFKVTQSQSIASHYYDVIMGAIASQITSLTIVYSTVYSDTDQSKHQSSASLAFVWEIHLGPVNFPHKWPVTRKMFPFDDVIMTIDFFILPGTTPPDPNGGGSSGGSGGGGGGSRGGGGGGRGGNGSESVTKISLLSIWACLIISGLTLL